MVASSQSVGKLIRHFGTLDAVLGRGDHPINDGLLGVTVLGLERFCIHEMETDEMGLRRAKVELLPNWPSTHSDFNDKLLVNRLREVFERKRPAKAVLTGRQVIQQVEQHAKAAVH